MSIYARAVPKAIRLTETYGYKKYISSNESLEELEEPSGKLEVIVPYDGYKYFSRQAIQDVEQQLNKNSANKKVDALIGHLAMSEYEKTDLEDLLYQSKQHKSVPIIIPVGSNGITKKQLGEDRYLYLFEHSYQPASPKVFPIYPEVEILDDDIFLLDLPSYVDEEPQINLKKLASTIVNQVKSGFGRDNNFLKGTLLISIKVRLSLPIDLKSDYKLKSDLEPQVKRVSIEWPTITSLRNLDLYIYEQNKNQKITYNPSKKALEWTDVSMVKQNEEGSNPKWKSYISQRMLLGITQPGDLYQENSLKGKIEIEIPKILLSGLQVQYYGFQNNKVGQLQKEVIPELKTRIIANFELILDQAFQKRVRSTAQQLIFDNILPTDDNVNLVKDSLQSQGFEFDYVKVPSLSQSTNYNDSGNNTTLTKTQWVILARRSEGIDTLSLWIVVDGEEMETVVEYRQVNRKFTRVEKTGKLTMYLLGQLPQNSYILLKKINELQKQLRDNLKVSERGPEQNP